MTREQIEAALEPFAKAADCFSAKWTDDLTVGTGIDGNRISIGDFRRAREALAALRSAKDEPTEGEYFRFVAYLIAANGGTVEIPRALLERPLEEGLCIERRTDPENHALVLQLSAARNVRQA